MHLCVCMYVCAYVFMYVCKRICLCMYVCVFMYAFMYAYICMCVCTYIYVCLLVCMYVYLCIFVCMCVLTFVLRVLVCRYMRMYVLLYVCVYMCLCYCVYVCVCAYLSSVCPSVCLSKVCSITRMTLRHESPSPAGSRTTDPRVPSPQPSHCTNRAVSPSVTFVNVRLRLCEHEFQGKCQARIRSVCHVRAVRCQQSHINRGVIGDTES